MSSTPPALHIVASCTDGKRATVPPQMRLQAHRRVDLAQTFRAWWSALQAAKGPTVAASDMYKGDHWAVTRQLATVGEKAGWRVRTWVASAGYGLVPVTALIHPYSATFSTGQPDSVTSSERGKWRSEARVWWAALSQKAGPDPNAGRSISSIASAEPNATILVAASEPYIAAMEDDLISARKALSRPERLLILTAAPGPSFEALKESWVRVEVALTAQVGGAMGALHARVARALLKALTPRDLSAPRAQAYVEQLAGDRSGVRQFNRAPLGDDEVKMFIRQSLREQPRTTHTPLLRKLRDTGRACEQGRFRDLFHQVQREM